MTDHAELIARAEAALTETDYKSWVDELDRHHQEYNSAPIIAHAVRELLELRSVRALAPDLIAALKASEAQLASMTGLWAKSDSEKQLLLGRIDELEANLWRVTEERDRAIEWRDNDKDRAEKAETNLEQAIKKGMLIATTIPIEEVQDAFDAAIAALKGGDA